VTGAGSGTLGRRSDITRNINPYTPDMPKIPTEMLQFSVERSTNAVIRATELAGEAPIPDFPTCSI